VNESRKTKYGYEGSSVKKTKYEPVPVQRLVNEFFRDFAFIERLAKDKEQSLKSLNKCVIHEIFKREVAWYEAAGV